MKKIFSFILLFVVVKSSAQFQVLTANKLSVQKYDKSSQTFISSREIDRAITVSLYDKEVTIKDNANATNHTNGSAGNDNYRITDNSLTFGNYQKRLTRQGDYYVASYPCRNKDGRSCTVYLCFDEMSNASILIEYAQSQKLYYQLLPAGM